MEAGKLRHRISIESPVPSSDLQGGETISWLPLRSIWANVRPVRGTEKYHAQSIKPEVTHVITCRYFTGALSKCRIVLGSRHLYIDSVIDVNEQKRTLEMTAIERTP